MKQMSLDEIQAVNVQTLFAFAEFCERHSLRYWLAYGTLLGAVRHEGIIPWDDDIDVWMPREDYEVFAVSFPDEECGTSYKFFYMGNDDRQYDYRGIVSDERTLHTYERRVTDLQYGLHIDVFPLDYQAEDERERRRDAKRSFSYVDFAHRVCLADKSRYLSSHSTLHGLCYRAARLFSRVVSPRNLLLREDERAKCMPKSNWIGIAGDNAIAGYRAEWFAETVELQFNGRKLHAPAGYDEILKTQYGDYMTLPPESERHPYGKGFWKDGADRL